MWLFYERENDVITAKLLILVHFQKLKKDLSAVFFKIKKKLEILVFAYNFLMDFGFKSYLLVLTVI